MLQQVSSDDRGNRRSRARREAEAKRPVTAPGPSRREPADFTVARDPSSEPGAADAPQSPTDTGRLPGSPPRLVIVLGMSETGLGALRLLARRGVRCWGVDAALDLPGFRSRYCRRRIHVPAATSPSELAAVLRVAAYGERERPVLVATSDRFVKLLSDARDALRDRFDMALPPPEIVDGLLDKRRFADLAARAGVRVARTLYVPDLSAVREALRQIGYPAVVKPRMPADQDRAAFPKAVILRTEQDARALWAAPGSSRGTPGLVVQEYIPGGDEHHVSVAMALDAESRPIATFVSRKRRQGNHGAGVGTFVESHRDPEAAGAARTLLQRIGYVGVAEVELKRHPDTGELFVIEVNPRLWSQLTLPAALGVDFAFSYCRVAAGDQGVSDHVEAVPSPYPCAWQDLWSDLYWTFGKDGYWRKGEVSLPAFLRQTMAARVHAYFNWRDPIPALRHAWQGIARTAGRERARP